RTPPTPIYSFSNRQFQCRQCYGAASGRTRRPAELRPQSTLKPESDRPIKQVPSSRNGLDPGNLKTRDESRPMPLGYLCLVLHAHLPYVRHPEYDDFLEEDWLYEAITETYIPLLEVFDGLERDGVDWRPPMWVTPTLAGMLSDPLLQYRYVRHIDNLIALAGKEVERTRWQPEFHHLALMYHHRFQRCRDVLIKQYGNNIVN